MKKKTLLQQAKEIKSKSKRIEISDEMIDLAIGWIKEEIGTTQASIILKQAEEKTNLYSFLAVCLKEAYQRGKIIEATYTLFDEKVLNKKGL